MWVLSGVLSGGRLRTQDSGLAGGFQAGRRLRWRKQTNQWYLKTERQGNTRWAASDRRKDMLWLAVINTLGRPWRYLGYKTCLDSRLLPHSIIELHYYKLPTPTTFIYWLILEGGREVERQNERDKTPWINIMKVRGEVGPDVAARSQSPVCCPPDSPLHLPADNHQLLN